jgi:hypothetical protein
MTDVAYAFGRIVKKGPVRGRIRERRTGVVHSFFASDVCGLRIGELRNGDEVIFIAAPSTREGSWPRAKQVHKR